MKRHGFTLMELLIVVVIIAILAGVALSALAGAAEQARAQRTKAIIAKLDSVIAEKWAAYQTRPVPMVRTITDPRTAAYNRLTGLRELQRLELPDRISDLCTASEVADVAADGDLDAVSSMDAARTGLVPMPATARAYKRRAQRSIASKPWTTSFQGAECLYLILAGTLTDGDKNAADFLTTDEVGDVDEDGMPEVLDGWGRPIEFLRWAPGYCEQMGPDNAWGIIGTDDDGDGSVDNANEAGWPGSDDVNETVPAPSPPTPRPLTMQTRRYGTAPDRFDPAKADPRWAHPKQRPYDLVPLIYSAGPDHAYDVNSGNVTYAAALVPSDPYFAISPQVGVPADTDADGVLSFGDNITNHYQEP